MPGSSPTSTAALDGVDREGLRRRRAAMAFRATAAIEAATWAGLLVGMAFKYVLAENDIGVRVFGPIHGVAFIAYVLATVHVFRVLGWSRRLLAVGLVCSVPPAATWIFERSISRRGYLA